MNDFTAWAGGILTGVCLILVMHGLFYGGHMALFWVLLGVLTWTGLGVYVWKYLRRSKHD